MILHRTDIMKKIIMSVFALSLMACASKPELPTAEKPPAAAKKPLVDDQTMYDLRNSSRWQKAVARRIASRVRQVRQTCQIYERPTSMSTKVSKVEQGLDVWTEETDTSWFKVYKDKSYGYVSKICF